MGLRDHIEEQIAEDLKLLKQYEDELRHEADPGRKGRLKARIEELKQRVHEHEEELRSLPVSSVQPESEQEVKPPTQPPPVENKYRKERLRPQANKQKVNPQSNLKKVEVRSERGVNYTQLRDLLAAQKWKEADQETTRVMCQVGRSQDKPWLGIEGIDNFPCEDLYIINQLWLYYSNGKFGFSVQKKIYESLGSMGKHYEKDWVSFCNRVGWRKREDWVYPWNLTFNLELAPKAHLPAGVILHFSREFCEISTRDNFGLFVWWLMNMKALIDIIYRDKDGESEHERIVMKLIMKETLRDRIDCFFSHAKTCNL